MDSAGNRSVLSNDMQELRTGKEEISNKIQGHKANLSNPNTSEASKENSKKEIDALGGDVNHYGQESDPRSKSAAENLEGSRAA
ncbi:hypothetical protein FVEN_g565 [Fusarium venenatum]|jgi:hypothetical protein|uniref:Conidiation protein con-6 n=2 Tax=Fusarium sambucinum species complex TaxID=569360 RepID=A0A2L2SY16_9HYPO|nr:uncharacterized protein FVRRES_07300 [Fusarium venenatum]XP_044709868.1 hypothetical protein FPOAC1_006681 [Fusarium poae]KAG8362272.1 hypothetical protein FVEN_g565 [Fusarium venenatum]KAG8673369.1 hypothetical protein FPOAC1_006681 [Fusarium poae]KAH6994229.1 hypothetical protein EDB82DRAFT_525308 [Fusarium venenatum]OBS25565.1 hypothetical protein FPOA_06099 [Fusarium poae]CEI62864.1 unnamed protein product [Fusarium venenatum]